MPLTKVIPLVIDGANDRIENVADPINPQDVATKAYADSAGNATYTQDTQPVSPSEGDTWFNTTTHVLKIYTSSVWESLTQDDGYF